MKRVCNVLGVARSNLIHRRYRSTRWQDGRRHRPTDDGALIDEIKPPIVHLPSSGYRQVWRLLRRERMHRGAAPLNAKRVYRVMRITVYCCNANRSYPVLIVGTKDGLPLPAAISAGVRMALSFVATMASRCA